MTKGGARQGAGRPAKPLIDKVLEGNPGKRTLEVLKFEIEETDAIVPQAPDWLDDVGKEIFDMTVRWLEKTGCLNLINPQHIEEYSQCKSRWRECEDKNSKLGLLAKHPTTGQPIQSPFVSMGIMYLKQADTAWNKIYEVIKQNCTQEFRNDIPHEDIMEKLLTMGRKTIKEVED